MFSRFCTHLFADDLAILIKGSIENKLSDNVSHLEEQAKIAMHILEKFSKDMLLPVNAKKTKAMLFDSVVNSDHLNVIFDNKNIELVSTFKYLGIELRCKLGWRLYIQNRLAKIRNIYCALR